MKRITQRLEIIRRRIRCFRKFYTVWHEGERCSAWKAWRLARKSVPTDRDGTSRALSPIEAINAGICLRAVLHSLRNYSIDSIQIDSIQFTWFDGATYQNATLVPDCELSWRDFVIKDIPYPATILWSGENISGFFHSGIAEGNIIWADGYCAKPISDHEKCGRFNGHQGDCLSVDSPECME